MANAITRNLPSPNGRKSTDMNDIDDKLMNLQARKRALKHAIREERIRQNAVDREQKKQERLRKLQNETAWLMDQAAALGIHNV